jgi:hypothetical protein
LQGNKVLSFLWRGSAAPQKTGILIKPQIPKLQLLKKGGVGVESPRRGQYPLHPGSFCTASKKVGINLMIAFWSALHPDIAYQKTPKSKY